MPQSPSEDPADVRAQVRLRLRRWLALLAPDAPRRSPLRTRVLLEAADGLPADFGPRLRLAITAALFAALHRAAREAGGDPFAAAARAWAAGAPGPATPETIAAWDALLTAVELRPSTVAPADVPRLLDRARAAHADHFAQTRWSQPARAVVEARGPGPWLSRIGADDVDRAVATLWATLEPALIALAPPAERPARVRQAMENLVDWDARVAAVAAEVSRVRGADAGQAVAARLLEPRVMAAYLTLDPDALLRLGLTCGRNLTLATLTGPKALGPPDLSAAPPVAAPGPDPEAALLARERWRRLFAGLTAALDGGALTPRDAVFLWLAAGVGAGEAWRATGGAPEKVGSANYARNKALDALRAAAGGAPARLANPGAPDPRSRSLLGLLAMRHAPDPSVEAEAGVPPDARRVAPPLDDRELVALMYALNLGDEAAEALPAGFACAPAALLARALRIGGWARARRAVVRARLEAGGRSPGWPGAGDLLFMLGAQTGGSALDAAAWTEGAGDGDGAVIERWLAAEGPAHEVIARLRGVDRGALPAPPDAIPRRPVEREARLRLHLRAVTGGEP